MSSQYVVVQYVPDPVAGERINVGVLAYADDEVLSQFLTDWKRVRAFGGEDITFLKDFIRSMQREFAANAPDAESGMSAAERIQKWAASWRNSIQFTQPRSSLHTPDALLRESVHLFLSEPTFAAERPRGHQQVVALTKTGVRVAVKSYVGAASERLTQENYEVPGIRQRKHFFDVAVANGLPYLAVQAVSLEVRETRQLHNALDAIAWSIADTREIMPVLPMGVVILPPREGSPDFKALNSIHDERSMEYQELGASVLRPDSVEDWATMALAPALGSLAEEHAHS